MDGLLRLCEALRLPTVVEGVETEAQCRALQSPAGLIVQGWHFSRALPAKEVAAFVRGREIHQFQ
jgi:sensor c-di-GMP phosphodiesterase-like protein